MPFNQSWYIHDHIVKVEFYGDISTEDISLCFEQSCKFLKESNQDHVHFIHDWSRIERFPTNPLKIRDAFPCSVYARYNKLGRVVVYGAENSLLRFLGDMTFQRFQIHCHMTSTLTSALKFLTERYPNLKPLLNERAETEVAWYVQGHILYCQGVFTAHQMAMRNRNTFELMEREGKPPYIHMLIDYSSAAVDNYSDVRELVRWSSLDPEFRDARNRVLRHPFLGWIVAIGAHNRNIKITGKVLSTRYNYKRKEVETVDDALTFLKQVDPNINHILQFSSYK